MTERCSDEKKISFMDEKGFIVKMRNYFKNKEEYGMGGTCNE